MLKSQIAMVSLILVESISWRKYVVKELNKESGDRYIDIYIYTTIHLICLEPTFHREKITNSALGVIVCLVEIMVICDL